MKVHRTLGRAGRARGEGDQADVVGGGRNVLECGRFVARPRLEALGSGIVPTNDALEPRSEPRGFAQLGVEAGIAEGDRDARALDRLAQFLTAQ